MARPINRNLQGLQALGRRRDDSSGRWRKTLGWMPFARHLVAMGYCLKDPATPLWIKAGAAAALAYFVMPFDLIPDWLPLIGQADDGGVMLVTLKAIARHTGPVHHDQARAWLAEHAE